jgi:2-polyprenyl-3-methyl-5-hydroxy-6-metoxy-1,4-benzoquinol methylase
MANIHCCPCCNNQLEPGFASVYYECTYCGYSCQFSTINPQEIRYEEKFSRNNLPEKYLQKKLADRIDYLKPLLFPNIRVAEIGCAEGFLGERIKDSISSVQYWGVEPSLDSKLASKRIDRVVSSSAQLLNQSGKDYFNVILVFHVLEHIKDIHLELQTWRKLLQDDGLIVVEVPNKSGNAIVANDRNPEHLHFFTPAALGVLMYNQGFDILSISCGHYESPAYNDCIRVTLKPIAAASAKQQAFIDSIIGSTKRPFSVIGIGGDFRSYLAPIAEDLPIISLVDNNSSMHGLEVCGMKVEPYGKRSHHDSLMLVSSIKYEDEIIGMLTERMHPISNIIKLSSVLNP